MIEQRMSVQAVKGKSRGVMVGSLIAFGWAFYGADAFGGNLRLITLVAAAGLSAALILESVSMMRESRWIPAETSAVSSASRRAWLWFWVNLVGEIVLLNVAIRLLGAPGLHSYWIPAISAVVGLHFWPMAIFFRARSYWYVGAAMILGANVAAVLVARHGAAASTIAHIEGLTNAVILWSALGGGVVLGQPRPARST